jgi:glycosyltransferase involved in cell wall biosynthesis
VEVLTPPARNGGDAESGFLERMLSFRREAASWIEGRRADLVQFRGIWEGLPVVEWAKRTGTAAVWEVHGFPSVELPFHFPGLAQHPRTIARLIGEERQILEASDSFVVPSRTSALFLGRLGVDFERISIVGNVADPAVFTPPPGPLPNAPPFRIVYQGTLAPWQGLETLIEALSLVRSRGLPELHVVGPGKAWWRSILRGTARRLRVHHALHLSGAMQPEDVPPVLRSAHLCVAPLALDARNSLQGCCPIKILEYMAAGRPILATRIGPVEELLEHGKTALLVRPGSATALAEGLVWMLEHPVEREAMGVSARERLLARHTPRHFREALSRALVRAAGRGRLTDNA